MRKRRIIRKIAFLFMCTLVMWAAMCMRAEASENSGETQNWVLSEDGTLTVSGPSTIRRDAFKGKEFVKLVIKEDVKNIQVYAFAECKNLTEVELAEGLEAINGYAFSETGNIQKILFPKSLERIGQNAFSGSGVEEIAFAEGAETTIQEKAFYNCSNLTRVDLPETITRIDEDVFLNCDKLSDIYFGGSEDTWNSLVIDLETGKTKIGITANTTIHFAKASAPETISISKASTAKFISPFTYTGKAITPRPTVWMDNEILENGTDYTVSYKNNINAGTAKMIITGKGKYTDSFETTFTITKAGNPMTVKGKTIKMKASVLSKKAQTFAAKKAFTIKKAAGKVTYKKKSGNKAITVSGAGKITVKKGLKKGTYSIKVNVTAAGNANYKKATKAVTFKVKVQ